MPGLWRGHIVADQDRLDIRSSGLRLMGTNVAHRMSYRSVDLTLQSCLKERCVMMQLQAIVGKDRDESGT